MTARKPSRVREQLVVYLDSRDRELLEQMVEATGLARTELFRRGLRRLAQDAMEGKKPGSSLAHLIATATDDGLPEDIAERHDHYLYGGGYTEEGK